MNFIPIDILSDHRGSLSFTQNNLLPFDIKRLFYLTNLSTMRGGHSHYECKQILYCINGNCKLYCTDGKKETSCIIKNKDGGFYTPPNHWLEITEFSPNCVILVLCSHFFDENDYCRDKNKFYDYIKNIKLFKNNEIIELNNIKKHTLRFKDELLKKFDNILVNGEFTYGTETNDFEKKFSEYIGVNHCIACSNGTTALILALQSLNLDQGSEVLIQSNSYVAGIIAILNNRLKIKWVDIDEDNLTININKIEENISNNTKVLLLVYLYGICPDMDKILELKNKYNLYLIEDCAQAHGSNWKNKKLGSFGDIACFSFYPTKNLGAIGEAGCITTNNTNIKNEIELLKNFGQKERYNYISIGNNYKSSNIIMSSLNLKYDYLDLFNKQRNIVAELYKNKLKSNKNIKFLINNINNYVNYHLIVIIVENRDELIEHLKDNNIQTGIHYPYPVYNTEAYKKYPCCYKTFDILSKKILSLPIYPELEEYEVNYICEKINNFYSY